MKTIINVLADMNVKNGIFSNSMKYQQSVYFLESINKLSAF